MLSLHYHHIEVKKRQKTVIPYSCTRTVYILDELSGIFSQIILLENQIIEAQNERDRYLRQAKAAKERLAEMETDRKDLADEYVVLKTNYLALTNEHKKEVLYIFLYFSLE